MSKHCLRGVVKRVVTDTVELVVEARDQAHAFELALTALDHYPEPVPGKDVVHMQTVDRNYDHSDTVLLLDEEDMADG